jgi:cation diffusion facilitator CzcD-associated flavoprotein CzcO
MAPSAVEQPPPLSLTPRFVDDTSTSAQPHPNEWYRNLNSNGYKIKEEPLYTPRPLRMIIIGAGAAGLEIAYKAERQLSNITFQIYEKNSDVGGTWLENRYPGCTCDIPSHSYQWSFWRNPNWSSYYAGAGEIWKYLKDFATSHDLERHIEFEHKVQEARWDEEKGVWEVRIQRPNGEVFVDKAEILASCHGVLK